MANAMLPTLVTEKFGSEFMGDFTPKTIREIVCPAFNESLSDVSLLSFFVPPLRGGVAYAFDRCLN